MVETITQLPQLQYLEVGDSSSLMRVPAIQALLTAAGKGVFRVPGFPHAFQRLQRLQVEGEPVTDSQLHELLGSLPALNHLSISHIVSGRGASHEPLPWPPGLLPPGHHTIHLAVAGKHQTPAQLLALPLQHAHSFSWCDAPTYTSTASRLVLRQRADIGKARALAQALGACGSVRLSPHPQHGSSLCVDCSQATERDMRGSDSATAQLVAALAPMASKLRGLILQDVTFHLQALAALGTSGFGEALRGLRMSGCSVSDAARAGIAGALPGLEHLHITVSFWYCTDKAWPCLPMRL